MGGSYRYACAILIESSTFMYEAYKIKPQLNGMESKGSVWINLWKFVINLRLTANIDDYIISEW